MDRTRRPLVLEEAVGMLTRTPATLEWRPWGSRPRTSIDAAGTRRSAPFTLGQLLAAWVTHDLDHVFQISRILARQYADEVGPWRQYVRIVRDVDPSA